MLRYARFAFLIGLTAAIPAFPQHQNKQETKDDNKKKAEPPKQAAKEDVPKEGDHIDRRNSRMKERNREIDGMLNKPKK